jgi:hypothetical protein
MQRIMLIKSGVLHITGLYMYAAKAARLRSARSWLRHSHSSLRHSLATLQTYGLLIRVAKLSYTTGTLDDIWAKLMQLKKKLKIWPKIEQF